MEHPEQTCASIPLLTQITRLRFLRSHALLASLGMHPSQFHLLALLDTRTSLSQAEIATALMVKPSTLTVMIRRMMRSSLVARKRDVSDKRILRVYRTKKGTELLEQARARFLQMENETFDGFTVEERNLFEVLAGRLRDNLAKAIDGEDSPCPWF